MRVIMKRDISISFDTKRQLEIAIEVANKYLKHNNPMFGMYVEGIGKIKEEFIYSYSVVGKNLFIPRGSGDVLREILKKIDVKLEKNDITDETCKGFKIDFKHKFNPRDDLQVEAINSFINNKKKNLILQGSCGFGKTFCALKILENLSVSTLILVDENLLLDQWIETITNDCEFDIEKLGIVGKGKEEYLEKHIIVASKDTLINRPEIIEYINENIGFVIVDEAHVASADIFQRVLKFLNPNRVLGLTATPKRSDGLSYLMHEQIGHICFKAEREKLLELGSVMNPQLRNILVLRPNYFEEEFKKHKEKELKKLEELQPDKDNKYKIGTKKVSFETLQKRKKAINYKEIDWRFLSSTIEKDITTIKEISKIIKHHYDVGDQSICICKKIEFAKKYLKTLKEMGVKEDEIAIILGETNSNERKELIAKAKAKEIKIIITSSILDKGISIDSANVLFLLYPSKNENSTEQRIGRVSRTQAGKTYAYVYDFIYGHGMFFSQFYKSQSKEYRECRWNVESYCTSYDKRKMYDFIKKITEYYYFGKELKIANEEYFSLENQGGNFMEI